MNDSADWERINKYNWKYDWRKENKTIQVHQDYNVILQRPGYAAYSETSKFATKQRSRGDQIDFMPSLTCFRNCLAFIIIGGPDEKPPKRRRLFAIMLKKASESGFVSFWCVLLLWRSFTPNQINIIFYASIPAETRHFNPCRDAQKVSFSASTCLLCLFEPANDRRNKFSLAYVVVARVPTSVQVSRSYDLFFVDFVVELIEMMISWDYGNCRGLISARWQVEKMISWD